MAELKITIGQYSDKGRKETNQDFHGAIVPKEPLLSSKGIVIALADGISSSDVGQVASESAVTGFFEDYYCTSEAWSVKTSALRVLKATNSWLHSQTKQGPGRFDKDKGYVCTFSAIIIKSVTAHILHIGDGRVYRLVDDRALEQLTIDHRLIVSPEQTYLSRALGIDSQLEIDYLSLPLEKEDIFLIATDGVYEYVEDQFLAKSTVLARNEDELDTVAASIAEYAYQQGSPDNLTIQIVRVDELPSPNANEIHQQLSELSLPPILHPRSKIDGYRIIRELHGSNRSHIYLAKDLESNQIVVIKTPSIDLGEDAAYLERFLIEEWVARRIDSAHVLKPCALTRKRNSIYLVTEYLDGQTLSQWMIDNPAPDLEVVREIIEQISKGLRSFHRLEMLHQDLRPENIIIDRSGTVKIIDFGSVRVAGIMDSAQHADREQILGTVQYTAPEYFVGEVGTIRSDLFSLGVIAYQMLTGKLPYGAEIANLRTKAAQKKLAYQSALAEDRAIPAWVDTTLEKAVHPNPDKRYRELSEFVYDLRHPNEQFLARNRTPFIERNPVDFWQAVSLTLLISLLVLLHKLVTQSNCL